MEQELEISQLESITTSQPRKRKSRAENVSVPTLFQLAAEQVLQSRAEAQAWEAFYHEYKNKTSQVIYTAICGRFKFSLPDHQLHLLWLSLVKTFANPPQNTQPTLVAHTIVAIINGPNKAKFWDLVTRGRNNKEWLQENIAKLLQSLGLPAIQDSLVQQFYQYLCSWYDTLDEFQRVLTKSTLPAIDDTWLQAQHSESLLSELIQKYLASRNWSTVEEDTYRSAFLLGIQSNYLSWLNAQRSLYPQRWNQFIQAPDALYHLHRMFYIPLKVEHATSWIEIYYLLTPEMQLEMLENFGEQILIYSIENPQLEHLRFFWDKVSPRPNLIQTIQGVFLERQFSVAKPVLNFLQQQLPADEFFASVTANGGFQNEPNYYLYQLLKKPDFFIYFWDRAGKQRQLEWLERSGNLIFLEAARRGCFTVVQAIWHALPEKHAELITAQQFNAFHEIKAHENEEDMLRTKKFLYDQNPQQQQAMLQADHEYPESDPRCGYRIFRTAVGFHQTKVLNWLWDIATSTQRKAMVQKNPSCLLWLMYLYSQFAHKELARKDLAFADLILDDINKSDPLLVQELACVYGQIAETSVDSKIVMDAKDKSLLPYFWMYLCCDYYFDPQADIPIAVQKFIAMAMPLSKFYEYILSRKDYHTFDFWKKMLRYNSQQADQFLALYSPILERHFISSIVTLMHHPDMREHLLNWQRQYSHLSEQALQNIKNELFGLQPSVEASECLPLPPSITSSIQQVKRDSNWNGLFYLTVFGAFASACVATSSMLALLQPSLFILGFYPPVIVSFATVVLAAALTIILITAAVALLQKQSHDKFTSKILQNTQLKPNDHLANSSALRV